VSTTKSGQARTLTLGTSTAMLWKRLEGEWRQRVAPEPLGGWVFAKDVAHHHRRTACVLGRRFALIRDQAGADGATLQRLRHNVATFLVSRGQILQAQARLGHADAATTLREYAYALPLSDGSVADAIDDHLDLPPTGPDHYRKCAGGGSDILRW
jgi:integrase